MTHHDEVAAARRRNEAAQWALELRNGDVAPERLVEWTEWDKSHPDNSAAFDQVSVLASGLASLPEDRKSELLKQLLPEFDEASFTQATPVRRPLRWLSLAASVLVAVGAAAFWIAQSPKEFVASYATNKAENKGFTLPDGTRIELGAGTRVDVAFTRGTRTLDLIEGEANFNVEADTRRPLQVRAGDFVITDIGTIFDVRKSGAQVMVTVAEGIVDVRKDGVDSSGGTERAVVSAAPSESTRKRSATFGDGPGEAPNVVRLTAGQQIRAEPAVTELHTASISKVSPSTTTSWRSGRLDFQDESFAVVIANVNRYAPREIVIVDPEISEMRFTGTVFQDRIEDWLKATQRPFNLAVKSSADGRVLLYAVK